jgi:thioredoxin 1
VLILTINRLINNEQDLDDLLATEALLVIECIATWHEPCQLIDKLMEKLADEYFGHAKVVKLDIDTHEQLALRLEVKSVPAVLFFVQGNLVATVIGNNPYQTFSKILNRLMP